MTRTRYADAASTLILDSVVHVNRENKNVEFKADTVVADTDLTDDELDDLNKHHAIREANAADLRRIAKVKDRKGRTALLNRQEIEMDELRRSQPGDFVAVERLREKHVAALNAL